MMTPAARPPARRVLVGLWLVGLTVSGLQGCSERPPPPPAVSAGMTRSAIRATLGEPTSTRQFVANGAKGMGPGTGFVNNLPVGDRVEVWHYEAAYVAVYFLNDGDTAAHVHSTYMDPDTAY